MVKGTENALFRTTVRADGSLQLTYRGLPLCRYQADAGPGPTQCQAVYGSWSLVDRKAQLIRELRLPSDPAEGALGLLIGAAI